MYKDDSMFGSNLSVLIEILARNDMLATLFSISLHENDLIKKQESIKCIYKTVCNSKSAYLSLFFAKYILQDNED